MSHFLTKVAAATGAALLFPALLGATGAVAGPAGHDWQGPYVGVSAGVIDFDGDASGILLEPSGTEIDDFSFSGEGGLVGVTAGLNGQWDNFVLGVEGDVSWTGASGTFDGGADYFSNTGELQMFGTLRGRAGFAVDNVLLYGTAGLAFGQVSSTLTNTYDHGSTYIVTSDTENHVGWTAGAGAELAVSDNMSVKAEALYYDLGSQPYEFDEGTGGQDITLDGAVSGWLARVGLNLSFD